MYRSDGPALLPAGRTLPGVSGGPSGFIFGWRRNRTSCTGCAVSCPSKGRSRIYLGVDWCGWVPNAPGLPATRRRLYTRPPPAR